MIQGGGVTNQFFQLKPDASGSYINGKWSQLASMSVNRLYFGSAVLNTDKLLVIGGEYASGQTSGGASQGGFTGSAEIYDVATNKWHGIAPSPLGSFGDDPVEVLSDGRVLEGYFGGPQTEIYDPASNTYKPGGTKLHGDQTDEEAWVKLPNGDILSYSIFASLQTGNSQAQYYDPSTNSWTDTGPVPVQLSSPSLGYELGPGILLPNGLVFQIGANNKTALYDYLSNSWTQGPDIPNGFGADDAPAAVLPDGHVIFSADAGPVNGTFSPPTMVFDYDPNTNTISALTPPDQGNLNGSPAFIDRMIMLPNGQMLFSDSSNQLYVYSDGGVAPASSLPAITGISLKAGNTYTLVGTQLNGPSEGAAYGDDVEMMSNYPIVTLTDQNGAVIYATTSNWSSAWVQTAVTPVSTDFTLPNGFTPGAYLLDVSGAGVSTNNVTGGTPANTALFVEMGSGFDDITVRIDPANSANVQILANGTSVIGDFPKASFSNIFVVGDTNDDTLTIDDSNGDPVPAGATLFYQGGTGNNTLIGPDRTASPNDWEMTGTDTGTLNNDVEFINVSNLKGGSGPDTFTFQAGGQVTGTLDGGPVGFDTIDFTQSGQGVPSGLQAATLHGFQDLLGAAPAITGTFDNIDFIKTAGTQLVVTTQPPPTGTTVGAPFGLVVKVEDGTGAVNPTFTGNITVFIAPGTGPGGATLGGITTLPAVNGVAVFSGLTLDRPGGSANGTAYELEVSTTGLNDILTSPFDIAPNQPTQLVVTTQPPGIVTAGQAFSFFVKAEDASGFVATNYNASLQVSLFNNPGSNPPINFSVSMTNGAAVINVPAGSLIKVGLGYTFEVIDNTDPLTVNPAITNNINVVAGTATQMIITAEPPGSLTAGTKFGLSAKAVDPFGNIDPSFNNSVSAAIQNNPGGSTLSGNVNVSANKGIITFSGLSLNKVGTGYILALSSNGLSSVLTTGIDITAGIAVQLGFSTNGQPPSSIQAGNTFGVIVFAEDYLGNLATTFNGNLLLSLGDNPTGGSLLGPLNQPANNGIAVFSGLSITTADTGFPNGYALLASAGDGSLTPGKSNSFDVTALAATHLAVLTQPPASVTAGIAFTTSFAGEDQYGNVDPTYNGTVSVNFAPGGNPGNTNLQGTLTQNATNGIATFSDLSLTVATNGYQLQGTALVQSLLSTATTSAFSVTAGTATQFVVTTQPSNVAVLAPIAFTVSAEDAFGNIDTTFHSSVKAAIANNVAGATLGGTLAQNAVNGVASFNDLTLNKPGVGYTLKATSGGLTATTGSFNVTAHTASQLVVTAVPSPGVTAGNLFTVSIAAEDSGGFTDLTFTGQVTIALANNPGGGSLGGTLTVNAVKGVATFSNLQLNIAATGYTLVASSGGLPSVTTNPFNVTAGHATQLVVTTQPGGVVAGHTFSMVVSAEDNFFNIDPTFTGNVSVALANNPGNTSLQGTLNFNAVKGVATFSNLKLNVAATGYTIQASASGVSAGTTNSFDVTAGTATKLVVTTQPSGVAAGVGFGFAVSAEDALGNVDKTFTNNVAVALFANPGNSTLGGSLSTKAVQGVATFSGLTLNVADPGYILQAIFSGLTPVNTAPFTVSAGQATHLVMMSQPPASVNAGQGFGFSVEALDAFGNVDTSFAGPLTAVISNNPGGSVLGGNSNATISQGIATFAGLTLNVADPGYTLQATGNGVVPVTTNAIAVNAGKATQLVITTQPPASVNAGSTITFVVAAEDSFGNIDKTFSNLVSASLATNPGGSTLSGTTPVTVSGGVASFTDLSLNHTGNGYVLQASTSGLSLVKSSAFSVTPAKADHFVMVTQPPSSVTAGQGFGFVLDAVDPFGNIDTSFNSLVAASLVNNPGGSTLGGNLGASVNKGVVTFSGLTLNRAGTGYTLQASANGVTPITTAALDVLAGVDTQLVVTTQPSGVIAGQGFSMSVAAEDAFGNIDANFGGTVSLALANDPGNTTLGGNLAVGASGGIATFSDLTLNVADPGYTIQASFPGLASATTNPFTVTAAKATQLVMATQPPSSVTAGQGFGFSVYAEDSLGNIDTSFSGGVSVALSANPGSSTLGGSLNATVSGGIATFSGLTINVADPGYTLQTSASGLTPVTTSSITVNPGVATQLVFTTQPPASVLVSAGFGFVVKAEDSQGNVDPTYNGTISVQLFNNPGNAHLNGNTSVTASQGVALFTGLSVDQAGTGDTLVATAPGLAPTGSAAFNASFSVPTTTASLTGTQGNAGWYLSAVTVSLSSSDPVLPVTGTFFKIDNAASFSAYAGPFQVTGDGQHTISYYSVNQAGRSETVETTSLKIDTTAPRTTASTAGIRGTNGWFRTLNLTLSATDATSGVAAIYYAVNGGAPVQYAGPTALPNGNLSVTYYSVDVAGNQEAAHTLSAKVDSTAPTTTANIAGTAGLNGFYISSVKVTLTAADNASGVATTYYRLGTTGVFSVYRGQAINFTTQGGHTITYYSVDVAGNKEAVRTTTVKIDSVAPPVTITTATPATVLTNNVTVAGTSQVNSSINVVLIDMNGKSVTAATTTDSTGHWSVTLDATTLAEGILTAQVTATDTAGNAKVVTRQTTKSSQVVMVLTQGPVSIRVGSRMPALTVQLQDGFGHNLALAGNGVSVAVPGANFTGTTTVTTNAAGQAIFSDLHFQSLGTYSLVFTAPGLTTIVSGQFVVGSGTSYPFWN
jgi:hypothetical protein